MTITTNLNRPATLALAEYMLWRTTLPTAPRGLGATFLDDFGATVGTLFDDGFVVDAAAQVITGAIAGHALTITASGTTCIAGVASIFRWPPDRRSIGRCGRCPAIRRWPAIGHAASRRSRTSWQSPTWRPR